MAQDLTPMMQQYKAVKRSHPDAILMFRLGDFYEMFFEDAILAAKELEIALTGRACGNGERAPMCGVPFHAADSYIARLVGRGHKVAICEQMEDPALAKGIVKREVIRIVTPSTILDDAFLSDRGANYLAVACLDERTGLTFADVSTGEVLSCVIEDDNDASKLINELARFQPVEIALGGSKKDNIKLSRYISERGVMCFSYEEPTLTDAKTKVSEQFRNADEISDDEIFISVSAMLDYLHETQKTDLNHIRTISLYTASEFLEIDAASRRNLELVETMRDKAKRGSLYGVLDHTRTAMGSRMLKSWILRPLLNAGAIVNRLNAVEEFANDITLRDELGEALTGVQDIERLMGRVSMGQANARDLASLRNSFLRLPYISKLLSSCKSRTLALSASSLDTLEDLTDLLNRAIVPEPPVSLREGDLIKAGFNEEIDRLRAISTDGKSYIAELEAKERERSGIKNLRVGYNKVFGYYIEVSAGNLSKVPEDYIRKQTLTNGERFITAELKEMESTVLGAQDTLVNLEYKTFCEVRDRVASHVEKIEATAKAVATADAILSLSVAAVKNDYVKPDITMSDRLVIKNGRHAVVEKMLRDSLFVPNDLEMNSTTDRTIVLTGPNMAGKSTYMRQNALIVLMAQMGSFVPASSCEVGIVDRIFTRVGASDDLAAGQSTFMLEMSEVAYILKNATKKSLCILDEIGRGTSTFDGLAIAWATVEHINNKIGAKTLFATHYHELTALEDTYQGMKNYNTACKKRGDDITFLRKIIRGGCDESYGIEVSKLAGVPDAVVRRAKDILKSVESGKSAEVKHTKTESDQGSLFAMMESPAIEALKSVDVTTLTPIEALNKLYELQKMI